MKEKQRPVFLVIVGEIADHLSFALGAAAVQTLHAAGTPPAHVVGEVTVKDQDGYKNDFLPAAQKDIAASGGKYVAGGFNKTVTFDGALPPNRVVILQFESMDKAKAWSFLALTLFLTVASLLSGLNHCHVSMSL